VGSDRASKVRIDMRGDPVRIENQKQIDLWIGVKAGQKAWSRNLNTNDQALSNGSWGEATDSKRNPSPVQEVSCATDGSGETSAIFPVPDHDHRPAYFMP